MLKEPRTRALLLPLLAFLICLPRPVMAQTFHTYKFLWQIDQGDIHSVLCTLVCSNITVTFGGSNGWHQTATPMNVGGNFGVPSAEPGETVTNQRNAAQGDTYDKDDMLAHAVYVPTSNPAQGGPVTPGSAVLYVNMSALPQGATADYINEDGTWNVNPYAPNATAPGPVADIAPPTGFTAGVRGAPVPNFSGYKYYFDYATIHAIGVWTSVFPFGPASGVIGYQNGNLCELDHTMVSTAVGDIYNYCVCIVNGATRCTVEARRKPWGVTGMKTSRIILETSYEPYHVEGDNNGGAPLPNRPKPGHVKIDQLNAHHPVL